jgi:glutamate-5-semialdehyde dehydrogenase
VTSDAAALALKAGSAVILRSGRNAWESAHAIVQAMQEGLTEAGLSRHRIQLVEDKSRASSLELMHGNGYIDLLIPRGGAGLIKACIENATVPCIQTGTGICHIYVDKEADLSKALNIIENAKTSRPSVCNAAEVCLVHNDVAETFLPLLYKRLTERAIPVIFRCDEKAFSLLQGEMYATKAIDEDFDTEFLDYILAIKSVSSVEEAIIHINEHSTKHSDCIVSENEENCEKFALQIDSAAVYLNASTRFTDGGEFGKGCEVGISTQKLHARGPMGLEELCSYKYIIKGDGQVR